MNEQVTAYNYLEDYLNKILDEGRHTFSLNEAKNAFTTSDKAIAQRVYRMTAKKNSPHKSNLCSTWRKK